MQNVFYKIYNTIKGVIGEGTNLVYIIEGEGCSNVPSKLLMLHLYQCVARSHYQGETLEHPLAVVAVGREQLVLGAGAGVATPLGLGCKKTQVTAAGIRTRVG